MQLKYKPYLNQNILDEHLSDLQYIEQKITDDLRDYPNFNGINFVDANAGGIQVNAYHRDIQNYIFFHVKLKYDFSNINEVIHELVNKWKELDNQNEVNKYQEFLSYGEKFGWD